VSKSISELQERILMTLWKKRCRFEWKKDNLRDEWIGRIPQDEWEASFPDTVFRKWTEQQQREWWNPDNWICQLENHSSQNCLYRELVPVCVKESERKKHLTVVGRAIQRLQERGLIMKGGRYERSIQIELTPWGSMYGWLLSQGRMTPALRAKKHALPRANQESRRKRFHELQRIVSELGASVTGTIPEHERIIERIRELSDWEKQAIFDELKLMVETSTVASESTDNPMELVNG
jgi:hypothetical protein